MTNARARVLIDRDKMLNAPRRAVAQATVRLFDRIQSLPREVQLLALASAFTLMASASNIPAQDAFEASHNLVRERRNGQTLLAREFQAMEYHLGNDILTKE